MSLEEREINETSVREVDKWNVPVGGLDEWNVSVRGARLMKCL